MKNQVLFSSKDKSEKLKSLLLQCLFGALKVNSYSVEDYLYPEHGRYIKCSQLSLCRLRLSRITAYLEEKI